jgi:ribosomal protein S18 acetylase RimI-like enzyme
MEYTSNKLLLMIMTTAANLILSTSSPDHLRPFDVRHDLSRVADLVELCFADSLDPDGQNYLRQMRSAARNPVYLHWASAAAERVPMPLSGYVWEEDRRLVGNLTLIPFNVHGRRYYLIANVAVHPEFRRMGIARKLTSQAIQHARQHGANAAWLHVREENFGAFNLYQSLGFKERARRTTWHSYRSSSSNEAAALGSQESIPVKIAIGSRRPKHWPTQRLWLNQLYPPELTWHLTLKLKALQPGLLGFFYRALTDSWVRQWSTWQTGRLLGVIAWQSTTSYADSLWLATDPIYEDLVAGTLLRHVRKYVSPRRPLSLDYPSGRAIQAIQSAGFHLHQTLIWMSIDTNTKKP